MHGITGDAFDTWTAPNGVLWLRDFLLQDLPGARVLYGYDAPVFFTKAAGDLDFFARTLLLEGIKQKRQGEVSHARNSPLPLLSSPQYQARPIIFVCHSMGGLVLKRVCGRSMLMKSEELKKILSS